jgi:hypothetical protein
MAHVFPNDTGAESGYFVDRFPLRECFICNHQWFLTWQEDI